MTRNSLCVSDNDDLLDANESPSGAAVPIRVAMMMTAGLCRTIAVAVAITSSPIAVTVVFDDAEFPATPCATPTASPNKAHSHDTTTMALRKRNTCEVHEMTAESEPQ
jgi:hypothetical protein